MLKTDKEVALTKGDVRVPRPSFFDLERMFADFFNRRLNQPFAWERPAFDLKTFNPGVDVIDREDEVFVTVEVPGYKKEDIEISVADNTLTIKGVTATEEKEERGEYFRCEISHGVFARTVALPAAVDEAKAVATLKDGMLQLKLPKVEKSKRRPIRIS